MLQWNTSAERLPPAIGAVGAPRGVSWNKRVGVGVTYSECFAQDPNFNGCWQDMFRLAQGECAGGKHVGFGYPDYNSCVEGRARANANQVCIPACEAYLRGGEAYPWGVYSSDTCAVQADVNTKLRARGMNPIAEDCKMGPATCGALDFLGEGTPASCQGHPWTAPTPSGGGGGPVPPPIGGGKKKSNAGVILLTVSALFAGGIALIRAG